MKKEIKYKCLSVSGSGAKYDEGLWRIKTLTAKTMVIEKLSDCEGCGDYEKGEKIRCGRLKKSGNPLREWGDGSFTIYPRQSGLPYYFEPI